MADPTLVELLEAAKREADLLLSDHPNLGLAVNVLYAANQQALAVAREQEKELTRLHELVGIIDCAGRRWPAPA